MEEGGRGIHDMKWSDSELVWLPSFLWTPIYFHPCERCCQEGTRNCCRLRVLVVQHTCPQNGHNAASLFS